MRVKKKSQVLCGMPEVKVCHHIGKKSRTRGHVLTCLQVSFTHLIVVFDGMAG